ncbi:centromere protein W-like isoform X1 [Choloepus didactylus]|uniref:centromere protein W-like isoform X1 n=1 Tax=Choloepus didactylus TaxID=27675 RepID=UPI00189F1D71|nr:centromere protein W-like isoform X1 [Choloepus didactylus]
MALWTTVPQMKQMKWKALRGFLKRVFQGQTPPLGLETSGDLLVSVNCLRLAEESRKNACENKGGIVKKEHVLSAAKVILKKSRG